MNKEATQYPAATMRPADVPQDPNIAYPLVENLIFDQVWKFHGRYGGDISELQSDAGLAYVKGHAEFITGQTISGKPITASYATSIRRWVWYSMFDKMRTRLTRKHAAPTCSLDDMEYDAPDNHREWDADGFTASLGDDARYVVGLLLEPNEQVVADSIAKGGEPRNYRSTVRNHLATIPPITVVDEDGEAQVVKQAWGADRINAAFSEIKRVLG